MDLGLLVVRAVLGLGMAAHGAQKLFGWWGGYGLQGTGGWLESQGFRPGRLFALAAGLTEAAGGLLTAAGLLGPVGPALVVSVMIVAIGVSHWGQGFFAQDGRTVQAFAIRQTVGCYERLRAAHAREDRPLHFVGHQANLRMLENVCRRCEIPPDRHHCNVEWYGNTGAASSATVLSMGWEKWQAQDDVAVVGVGAGLTWASYYLRFGDAP